MLIRENAFEQEMENRVKFNPGLSANGPLNNWALEQLNDLHHWTVGKTEKTWLCCCGWWKLRKSEKEKVEDPLRPRCKNKLSTVINRPTIDDANCYSWLRTVRIDQFMLTALKTVSSFFRNASI